MSPSPVQYAVRVLLGIVAAGILIQGTVWVYKYGYNRGTKFGREQMYAELEVKGQIKVESQRANAANVVKQDKSKSAKQKEYIERTEPEVRDATKDLAGCTVPDAAVKLWNETSNCLLEPGSPGCGVR